MTSTPSASSTARSARWRTRRPSSCWRPVARESRFPMNDSARLFLCGDVMTGRGIDQVLPHPCAPQLFEQWAHSANDYVDLAQQASGAIGRGLDYAHPWGDALAVLQEQRPDARLVNLETAVTTSEDAQPGKGIHYRMHPENLPCLVSAGDRLLRSRQQPRAGLGPCRARADTGDRCMRPGCARRGPVAMRRRPRRPPCIAPARAGAGAGLRVSPRPAAARLRIGLRGDRACGVNLLESFRRRGAGDCAPRWRATGRPGDIVVVSVHWGGNWGFEIPREERAFAHALVDAGGADIVHGHSSHHVKGIEVRARQAHPLRLRRLHQRLRRHRRPRRIPARALADVLPGRRHRYGRPAPLADGADADAPLPAGARPGRGSGVAARHPRPGRPCAGHADAPQEPDGSLLAGGRGAHG